MITTFYKISVPPPLDIVSGAAVAVGVRKLYSGYMGKCMRIRRSTDNAEQDIGFNGLDLDVAAFSAFVGAGTGYITTLYDQSGNGHNATQTTAANQPVLSLNYHNGKPAIKFTATSQTFVSFGAALGKPANFTVLSCFSITNTSSVMWVFGSLSSSNSNGWGGRYMNRTLGTPNVLPAGNTSYNHSNTTDGTFDTTNAVFAINTLGLVSDSYASGVRTHELRKNGVIAGLLDTNGTATSNGGTVANFSIGRAGDYTLAYFDGYFTDFVHYTSKLTDAQQLKLEQSYNDYYAIY